MTTLEQMSYTAIAKQRRDPLFIQQSPRILRRKHFRSPLFASSSKKLVSTPNIDSAQLHQEQFRQGVMLLANSPHKTSQFPSSIPTQEPMEPQAVPKPRLPKEFKYTRSRPQRLEFLKVSMLLDATARSIAREPSESAATFQALQSSSRSVKSRRQLFKGPKPVALSQAATKHYTPPPRTLAAQISSVRSHNERLRLTSVPRKSGFPNQFLSGTFLIHSYI